MRRSKPRTEREAEDHRVRTGAVRREQTRRKLIESALIVFAAKGIDAPVIDDFIEAAGVSRGTFYNHFDTIQDLFDAVSKEVSDIVLSTIDSVVLTMPDPLNRLVCACLLYMRVGLEMPHWGAFIVRASQRSAALGKLVDVYMPRDIDLAWRAGQLEIPSVRAARDLLLATIHQSMQTVQSGQAPHEHLRQTFGLALRGIVVSPDQVPALVQMTLPSLPLPSGLAIN